MSSGKGTFVECSTKKYGNLFLVIYITDNEGKTWYVQFNVIFSLVVRVNGRQPVSCCSHMRNVGRPDNFEQSFTSDLGTLLYSSNYRRTRFRSGL